MVVMISPAGNSLITPTPQRPPPLAADSESRSANKAEHAETGNESAHTDTVKNELAPEELRQIHELKNRDRDVRAHESAHRTVGGDLIRGAVSYSYQKGPDGRLYVVGGEVSIDTSGVPNNPEATLARAQRISAAALAPVNPSSADRAVAAAANQMAAQARIEITTKITKESGNVNPSENDTEITAYEESANNELRAQKGGILNEVI